MMTPPTDSIYKFLAIAGLVLIIWGISFPESKKYELSIDSVKLAARIKGDEKLSKKYQNRVTDIDLLVDVLVKDKAYNDKSSQVFKHYLDFQKELHEIITKLSESSTRIESDTESNAVMVKAVKRLEKVGFWSFWIGGVFVITGFVAWYIKLQRYLDRNVKENDTRED
jgi:hypothetical protein